MTLKTSHLRYAAHIPTPEGIALHVELKGNLVTIVNHDGESLTFSASLIPEVRGVLLDVEGAYGRGDNVGRQRHD